MPELNKVFSGGAMNKDLDERLIPQGFYRDAQNIEILTSEGSNVGSVQNILGNQERKLKTSPTTEWSSGYISNLTNPECIGSIADTENNKIYWFIATSDKSVSAIAEYNVTTKVVSPVLVDKNNILNFSSNYLITGVNVIDGLLFWTDNQTEPKKVNIAQCKEFHQNPDNNADNFTTHTQINDVLDNDEDFKEEHITVIKQSPLKAPTLTQSATKSDGGVGIAANPVDTSKDFSDGGSTNVFKAGRLTTINVDFYPNAWSKGDIIKISRLAVIDQIKIELSIRATVLGIRTGTTFNYFVDIRIISIDDRIGTGAETWECVLEEDDPLYKLKFVRFAYRYKYNDSEYSCFSPFSDTAFVPGTFDYRPHLGSNLGMENILRELTLTFPDLVLDRSPNNVESVDILYKESNNNNVRIVTTLKPTNNIDVDDVNFGKDEFDTTFTITREILKSLVESNQLLRPWDNVPRKAKAQELVGNRVIYGNYIENYDVDKDPEIIADQLSVDVIESQTFISDGGTRKFTLSPDVFTEFPIQGTDILVYLDDSLETFEDLPRGVISNDPSLGTYVFFTGDIPGAGSLRIEYDRRNRGHKSVKSQRTYQLGVVYQDKYGRQSPVFTSQRASVFIEKQASATINKLIGNISTNAPGWATHYKWFIKEGTNEYYNLVLDTFYAAEDGNVWLTFPSSEVNKILIGDYIELKKQHNAEIVVSESAKFKVIDISLEPPPYVEFEHDQLHKETVTRYATSLGSVGLPTYQFSGPTNSEELSKHMSPAMKSIRFTAGTGVDAKVSGWYEIIDSSVSATNANKNSWEFTFDRPISPDDVFLENATQLNIELRKKEPRRGAHLSGKFWVKVLDGLEFQRYIREPSPTGGAGYQAHMSLPERNSQGIQERIDNIDQNKPQLSWRLNAGNNLETWTSNKPSNIQNDPINLTSNKKNTHPELNNQYFGLTLTGFRWNESISGKPTGGWSDSQIESAIEEALSQLQGKDFAAMLHIQVGSVIRFSDETGKNYSELYEVLPHSDFYEYRNYWDNATISQGPYYFTRVWKIGLLHENTEGYQATEFTHVDGSVGDKPATRIEIMMKVDEPDITTMRVKSPAIFETEPRDIADLDLYHEISDAIGIIKASPTTNYALRSKTGTTSFTKDVPKVINANNEENTITLDITVNDIDQNETLTFIDLNTGFTSDIITSTLNDTEFSGSNTIIHVGTGGHVGTDILSWSNCFTFGNGVESNRIRDDYNQVFLDKGPKVSTILERSFKEEHKKASLIYSGIYINKNGINGSNQFIQGEKITKNLNPEYGSIQKLNTRDSDLTACCEDKIINIVANKDALFNADGNPQLISSTNVLGQAIPYVGEHGISKNPESFVSHAYRSYFTDSARGTVLRLSRDGLTDIGSKGMGDYFGDNLKTSTSLMGSYNEDKDEYILTLKKATDESIAFSETAGQGGGWTSFRSYIPESGVGIDSIYYTFKNGLIYSHDNTTRNTFYGGSAVESSINVMFNEASETIKSFKTIAYEGTQQRKYRYEGTINSVTYGDNDNLSLARLIELTPTSTELNALTSEERQAGWYLDSITTDLQTGSIQEFVGKENKYYNHLRGDSLDDTNLDSSEISVQGIGKAHAVADAGGQTTAEVNVIIKGLNVNELSISGTPTGYSTNSTNDEFTKTFTTSTALNTITIDINLDPNDGYSLPTSLTISGNATASSYNSTTGTVTLTLTTSGTVTTSGHTETITITSPSILNKNNVAGEYIVQGSNIVLPKDIGTTKSYSATGYEANTSVVVDAFQCLSAVSANVFGKVVNGSYVEPTAGDLLTVDTKNDINGRYKLIMSQKNYNSNGQLVAFYAAVEYTFGSESTITDDEITINLPTVNTIDEIINPKITRIELGKLVGGKFVLDNSTVGHNGANDIRYFKVSGNPGAKFGITRRSPGPALGWKLNGANSDIAADALTIPDDQNFLLVKVECGDRSAQMELADTGFFVNSTYLKDDFYEISSVSPTEHIQIDQHGWSKLKLAITSSNYGGSGSGIGTDYTVYEDVSREFLTNSTDSAFDDDTAITAKVITAEAETRKVITNPSSPTKFIPFKYVFDHGASADDTLNRSASETIGSGLDFSHTGNGGANDDDGFDITISNLTTTLTEGSGGNATKLTVMGLATVNQYGDGSSTPSSGYNILNFNPDALITKGSGVSSLYVNLFGAAGGNIATTTSRGDIPVTINIGTSDGTNYTGTVTFVPLASFFNGKTTSQITISYTLDGFTNNGSATNPSGWTGAYTGGTATIAINVNLDNASGGNLIAGDAPLTIQYSAS